MTEKKRITYCYYQELQLILGLPPCVLERENSPFNRVQQNVSRFEVGVHRPSTQELEHAALLIILRMAIEEADLLEVATRRVELYARDIDNAEPRAVVGLVTQALDNLSQPRQSN